MSNNSASSKKNVESLMLKKGLITNEQLEKAKAIQGQTLEKLEEAIIRLGFLSEKQVLELWAEVLSTSVVDLTNIKVDAKLLALIPEDLAKHNKIIPYKRDGSKLTVVMADPFDIMTTDMLAFLTQCRLEVLIAPKSQIELAVRQLYSWDEFSVSGDESLRKVEALAQDDSGLELVRKTSEQGAVIQFLNTVFKQAILKRASDIHVEPREDNLMVRFRIDGILHDAMTGPKSLIAPLISRIKILSHLDISERRLPQDGRLKVKMQDNEVDFRVSTVPSLLGEKAVMRLLQRETRFELDNIGFFDDDLARLKSVLDEPYGMVLVTGPTGAGKTTTLFGMLKYFDSSGINIFTIENPIEYRMAGITQVQINEKIGLDFASGLRAALRQDPDIILVGEIRDLDTADIAFRASLTGHKVLSTLHTNNASSTVNRLINMGLPPYLLTAAVRVIVAQKLLHKNCPHCSVECKPTYEILQRVGLTPAKSLGARFLKGPGCKECNYTGVLGRLAAYETMVISDSLKDVIMSGGTESTIKRMARMEGMRTLRESSIVLAQQGKTTLEEVIYSTPPDEEERKTTLAPVVQVAIEPMAASGSAELIAADSVIPQPQGAVNKTGLDMEDPVVKPIVMAIEKDYLFFEEEKLAERLNISSLQVAEIKHLKGLERTKAGFANYFAKKLEGFEDSEIEKAVEFMLEKGGEIPEFIMAEEAVAEKWAIAATKYALGLLKKKLASPDDLPKEFNEEFILTSGLEKVFVWAGHSIYKLVDLTMPNMYKPWQFGEIERWIKEKANISVCAREAVAWLMTERLGCSRGDLPQMLNKQVFEDNKLGLLLEKFDNSCFNIVDAVFPRVFRQWQFTEDEQTIWFQENKMETAKEATRWLVEERLGIPVEEVPKRVALRDFHANGLSKLLDLFNQNLFAIIENAYPFKFMPWQFNEQAEIWKAENALEVARQATEWLITDRLKITKDKAVTHLTRRHFLSNGLGNMLGALFNHSHFMALENLMPELKNNESYQKNLYDYAQEILELTSKWSALSEKIALTQFGKARFKVAMPNLKTAPIVPENERIYINASNQIEYVPQIVIPKLNAYSDFTDFTSWVPYCDRLTYWILGDDRSTGYFEIGHPKVKLVFLESLIATVSAKGMVELAERLQSLNNAYNRLLDFKIMG
jgi:type IV pilus assembly protein PilB